MGLASSQARLLLITARKSDLEYRSQMISQRKIMLAMQTETLATTYSQSLSNRKLTHTYYVDGNDNKAYKEDLKYATVIAQNGLGSGSYSIVVDAAGNLVVPTGSNGSPELPTGFTLGSDGKTATSSITGESFTINVCDDVNNMQAFQSALRAGTLYIAQVNANTSSYENKTLTSVDNGSINDELDTSDDAKAEAKYEAESLVLSVQDKQLDLELKQIETQHKALETEYDSVKKVIDKNIEVSFKIFAQG